ncbi:MAG: glycyl-tRNA synthetase beta chain [Paracoccaceae bacterium]|jgi:glycyl-tRNA synthetase beta chain
MAELLLELFSEEIPARMQERAADDLKRLVTAGLKDAGLAHGDARAYVTPRRLTLVVEDLPEKQPDLREEKRGPKVDAPEKAIEGFLKANGLTREACEERALEKGTFLFAVVEKTGAETRDVLPGLLEKAIGDMPWPKSMRWGAGDMRWVRSLERVLCLFGSDVLPLALRNDIPCGKATSGHRFLAPATFEVDGFADYANKLRHAFVVLDRDERKAYIAEHAEAAASAEGLSLRDDPGLLDEVTGLVEWPVVMTGKIDDEFMDVPDEVLITSMRAHQKYFSLLNADGSLAPRFVVVANTETKDDGASIVAGNERVLRARLSDAKFFWDQDRRKKLEDGVPKLADSVFHAKLGTMAQKVERITALAGELATFIPGCDADRAMRAAHLAKADLVTEMVYEFPELQGTMGRYYALNDGEDAAVADAIAEHYSPAGPNDDCPTAPASVAVALADKLDTLVGFFAVDEKPTGSRDPYALRRAALGIIRLVLENGLRLPLREALMKAYWGYSETVPDFEATLDGGHKPKILGRELLDFFADRLKVHLRERGVRHDHVEAVFALGNEDDLVRLIARVDALSGFLASDDGENLVAAYKRASNIVAIEEKKDGVSFDGEIAIEKLAQDEERALVEGLSASAAQAIAAIDVEKYVEAMEAMSTLRAPVDLFFDKVTVNADDADIRINRLRLLSQFRSTLGQIADFSRIES